MHGETATSASSQSQSLNKNAEGHMSQGTVVQCIGPVVDVQFPREGMPKVYDALILEDDKGNTLVEQGLTFEVQQQLGDGVVRTIAMGSSDGLKRGMKV